MVTPSNSCNRSLLANPIVVQIEGGVQRGGQLIGCDRDLEGGVAVGGADHPFDARLPSRRGRSQGRTPSMTRHISTDSNPARVRRIALVGFALLLVSIIGVAVGLVALTGGGGPADATVETFEPRVAVGNESADAMSGSEAVVTCNDRGPPPGIAAVEGRLEFGRPPGDEGPQDASFRVIVTVGDALITDSLNVTLQPGDSTRYFPLATVDQPEALSGGDRVTVTVQITTDGTTVASANRTVQVDERDIPCEDEREI